MSISLTRSRWDLITNLYHLHFTVDLLARDVQLGFNYKLISFTSLLRKYRTLLRWDLITNLYHLHCIAYPQ